MKFTRLIFILFFFNCNIILFAQNATDTKETLRTKIKQTFDSIDANKTKPEIETTNNEPIGNPPVDMYEVGGIYFEGGEKGIERIEISKEEVAKAAKWYFQAALKGDIRGYKGLFLMRREDLSEEIARAIELAEKGDVLAQFCLGEVYLWGLGGVALSRDDALKFFSKAATQGFGKAQYRLGEAYY